MIKSKDIFNKGLLKMALKFHPKPGTILMCDFDTGFQVPEMVKNRPVIVLSPKRKRCSGLCTVVAISTREPDEIDNWCYQLPKESIPNLRFYQGKTSWVKGDMVYRVSFNRLNLIKVGKDKNSGNRLYFDQSLEPNQLKHVYSCVLNALNLDKLTQYL